MRAKIHRFIPNADEIGIDNIDYVRGLPIRLEVENIMVKGEIQQVNYYVKATKNPDGTVSYEDLVVREDIVYTRDAEGFAQSRDMAISWYDEEDKVVLTKKRHKTYDPMDSIREGKRRRGNVIDVTMAKVAGMLMATGQNLDLGRQFAADHGVAISAFIDVAKDDINASIVGDASTWLDTVVAPPAVTIRDVMLSEVDIWS